MSVPCLTVHQPYASLIACGAKRHETRGWAPSPKQLAPGDLLAIHASKRVMTVDRVCRELWADGGYAAGVMLATLQEHGIGGFEDAPVGAVLCVCRFIGCYPTLGNGRIECPAHSGCVYRPQVNDDERLLGDFSPGRFAWELEVVEVLDPPIPARGRQRLWDWEPPAGLTLPPARSDD